MQNDNDTIKIGPHWWHIVTPIMMIIAGFIPMLLGGFMTPLNPVDTVTDSMRVLIGCSVSCCGVPAVIGGGLLLVMTVWAMTRWHLTISPTMVSVERGYVGRKSDEIYIRHIESVSVRKGLLGAVLNCGKLVIGGSGGTKLESVYVADPQRVRKLIYDRVNDRRSYGSYYR